MNKMLIIIALIVLPSLAFGQTNTINTSNDSTEINTVITKEVALKKIEKINIDAKVIDFSYKKSKDLTSIKAYIRSLQLKRKETLVS